MQDWLRSNWPVEHEAKPEEIRALLMVADRELADSRVPGLSTDGKFNHAYNAALQAAAAGLAASGYRAARGSHHYVIIQSLAQTLAVDARTLGKLDGFRKKRNAAEYEITGAVTELQAEEMAALASRLRTDVEEWLRRNHPESV